MAINEDGNEIGKVIDADSLLTQIAKARIASKQKLLKPVVKATVESITKPKAIQKSTVTKKV